jgi:hypothetical protein
MLAGTAKGTILGAWEEMKRTPKSGRIPKYWDGRAAVRSLEALHHYFLERS